MISFGEADHHKGFSDKKSAEQLLLKLHKASPKNEIFFYPGEILDYILRPENQRRGCGLPPKTRSSSAKFIFSFAFPSKNVIGFQFTPDKAPTTASLPDAACLNDRRRPNIPHPSPLSLPASPSPLPPHSCCRRTQQERPRGPALLKFGNGADHGFVSGFAADG